jgi:hypothetical protein
VRFHEAKRLELQRPGRVVPLQPGPAGQVQRIHDLAVDVELELLGRGVADPHRVAVVGALRDQSHQ